MIELRYSGIVDGHFFTRVAVPNSVGPKTRSDVGWCPVDGQMSVEKDWHLRCSHGLYYIDNDSNLIIDKSPVVLQPTQGPYVRLTN